MTRACVAPACLATLASASDDDEVGGRLDRRREPLGQRDVELHGDRRAGGERLERRVEPALGEHGGMDAGGELAQLLDRRARVGERAADELARARPGSSCQRCSASCSSISSGHEPLLGAVVEVAAEPAALAVARLDDPRARLAQRLDARPQLDLEAVVLDRQRGGAGRGGQQRRVVGERGVVDEHADAPPAVDELGGDGAPSPGGSANGRPSRST